MRRSPLEQFVQHRARALAAMRSKESRWVCIKIRGPYRKHTGDLENIASWNRRVCNG